MEELMENTERMVEDMEERDEKQNKAEKEVFQELSWEIRKDAGGHISI